MRSTQITAMASWLKALKKTAEQAGLDSTQLFREAGLDPQALDEPHARYSVEKTTRLWHLLRAQTGDSAIGLRVARNVDHTTFNVLGYAVLASPTLLSCFERIVRYFRIVTNAATLSLVADRAQHRLVIETLPGDMQPADEAEDALMCVLVGVCRLLHGSAFEIAQIRFRRAEPVDRSGFDRVFRAPLLFGQAHSSIAVDNTILERALPSGNADLARYSDRIMDDFLAKLAADDVASRVHAAIVRQLPYQEPDPAEVAMSLGLSQRSLQRRLGEQGTSYSEVLDATRRELAMGYVSGNEYAFSEITYLLGFANTSSFTRAFKRWTDMTPRAYRQQGASK